MSLRCEILGLLSYKDNTGYELTKMINSNGLFFWQAQQSQVYREIVKLEEDKLICANEESTPHKKIYSLTPDGKNALIEWLNEKDIISSIEIRNPLVMKLFFSNIADRDKTIGMLEEYKAECRHMLDEIAESQQETLSMAKNKQDTVFFSLNSFYGVGFYNFSIEWADKCIKVLRQLKALGQ